MLTLSNVAFGGALLGVLAIAVFGAPVKPWLYVAGGLLAVGFITQPSTS